MPKHTPAKPSAHQAAKLTRTKSTKPAKPAKPAKPTKSTKSTKSAKSAKPAKSAKSAKPANLAPVANPRDLGNSSAPNHGLGLPLSPASPPRFDEAEYRLALGGRCHTCGDRPAAHGHDHCCRGCATLEPCQCGLPPIPPPGSRFNQGQFNSVVNMFFGAPGALPTHFAPAWQPSTQSSTQSSALRRPGQGWHDLVAHDTIVKPGQDCAVCMDALEIGDKVIRLPCLDQFHAQCIGPWLNQGKNCPTCRTELVQPHV